MKKKIIEISILAVVIIMIMVGLFYCKYPYKFHITDDGTVTLDKYIGRNTEVIIPDNILGKKVTVIGEKCFFINEKIEYVYIPKTVEKIDDAAFMDCINLEKVEGGENVKNIMELAFSGDKKLYSIFSLANLEEINDGVFGNCLELEHIEISDKVMYIGLGAFCATKVDYNIVPPNTKYVDGSSFERIEGTSDFVIVGDGIVLKYPDKECVEIPDGVKMVNTFSNVRNHVTEVLYIPNTVYHLEYDVLEGAEHGTIYIPESVKQIGEYFEREYEERELFDVAQICGIKGSYAEDYAKRYNIPFEEVERWY